MTIDLMGGVFSDLSLVFKPQFDAVAGVTYSMVIVSAILYIFRPRIVVTDTATATTQLLDGVVLVAAATLNPRAKRKRQREATVSLESGISSLDGQNRVELIDVSSIPALEAPPGRDAVTETILQIDSGECSITHESCVEEKGQDDACKMERQLQCTLARTV